MKNYAKVGRRPGKPAYRTPSSFQGRHCKKTAKIKPKKKINAYQSKSFS